MESLQRDPNNETIRSCIKKAYVLFIPPDNSMSVNKKPGGGSRRKTCAGEALER
jgi:hypothetical protein